MILEHLFILLLIKDLKSVYKEFKEFYLENILKVESENDLKEKKIISYNSFKLGISSFHNLLKES